MGRKIFEMSPIAEESNVIKGDKYRITLITEALIRLEYNENGNFVDGATQVVINRNLGKVDFKLTEDENGLEIITSRMKLYYDKKKFSSNGLKIKIYGANVNYNSDWCYGMEFNDLGGTARTLDNVNGAIPLERGVIGRSGFSVLDDSKSLIINEDFVESRSETTDDFYVFCYGHEYREALQDFYRICGQPPMLPRYALGNWWSRYYRYSEESYMELMDCFAAEGVPFSVAVIDMDWHLTDIDKKYGSGWTGYTWNKELFENPERFLKELHNRGMHVTLNVHPAEGVRGFEDCYKDFAAYMELDVENEEPIQFDCTDKKFMDGYFKYVHHPLEKEGVDFWWIDWQQGTGSKIAGLDPLWILNHFHFLDNAKNGNRPMTFSRYAGPGSHRYPVGFSGDTHITWESLDFQPEFTATASNIGYGWWSHDIGGHMLGKKDNELELRWYQFGVFSPIMRLHSSCNEFAGKEPFNYPLEIHAIMNDFLRLRHRMIPYLYSMNYLSHKGRALMSPMYYDHPEEWDAYVVNNQYYFGTQMIVAPITTPNIKGVNMAKVKVLLPEGTFFDIFTDTVYTGGRYVNMYRDYYSIPVLAKAGAIIPITDEIMGDEILKNPTNLSLNIYPGANGEFDLYEDDGCTTNYLEDDFVITKFVFDYENGEFKINKPEGNLVHLPEKRNLKLEFMASTDNEVVVYMGDSHVAANYGYDEETRTFVLIIKDWDYTTDITVKFKNELKVVQRDMNKAIYDVLQRAEISYNDKDNIYRSVKNGKSKEFILSEITARDIDFNTAEALRELILAIA